jgi:hypothetical protein
MSRHRSALAVAVLVAAAAAPTARADSMRCPGGIVQTGDAKIDVLAKCGRPTLVDEGARERSSFDARNGVGRRVFAPEDVWTYDFGPSQFIQVVRIVRGRVTAIGRGSWGYADSQPWRGRPAKATCEPAVLSAGKLTLEILSRCGEPATIDEWEEETSVVVGVDGPIARTDVVYRRIALWTYDFGPSQFLRFVRVEDGWVTRVDTGSYGYAD